MLEIVVAMGREKGHRGDLTVRNTDGSVLLGPLRVAAQLSAVGMVVSDPNCVPKGDLTAGISPGEYRVEQIYPLVGLSQSEISDFGRFGMVVLSAIQPNRLFQSEASNASIFIYGGALDAEGELRTAENAVRLSNVDMHALVAKLLGQNNVTVRVLAKKRTVIEGNIAVGKYQRTGRTAQELIKTLPLALAVLPLFHSVTAAAQDGGGDSGCYDDGSSNTKTDFSMIETMNGGSSVSAYVPSAESGVTVAGGLDLGQYTERQLLNMGFTQSRINLWAPYLAQSVVSPCIGSVASKCLKEHPYAEISIKEAKDITKVYYAWAANSAASAFNALAPTLKKMAGTTFADLSLRYQTAITALFIADPLFTTSSTFSLFAEGEWIAAINSLYSYSNISASINKVATHYADYLAKRVQT